MREPTFHDEGSGKVVYRIVALVIAFIAGAALTAFASGNGARDAIGAPLTAPPELRVELLLTPQPNEPGVSYFVHFHVVIVICRLPKQYNQFVCFR